VAGGIERSRSYKKQMLGLDELPGDVVDQGTSFAHGYA
jgi:hypothetical protein